MPTRKITDLFAERVKPPARGRIEYFDAAFGSLALRVTSGGHKSWSLFYRTGGRLRRYTLGVFPALKPADARRGASRILEMVAKGTDPLAEKKAQRYVRPPEEETFAAVVRDYLERFAKKNTASSTYAETKRVLEGDDLKAWQKRPLAAISRRDVNDVIDAIATRAEVQANRTLAKLRALFNWAVDKVRIPVSPLEGLKPPTKEQARDRALSDDEIRWFWTGCEASGWPFGPLAQLLLLTAQRRDEVAGMEWGEIDFKKSTWSMPRQKAKNNRAHEVSLSAAALVILRALPRVSDRIVFTTTGKTPVSGFSRAKRRLDKEMEKARRTFLNLPQDDQAYRRALDIPAGKPLPVEIPRWIVHDLRRTAATGMARLNVPPHVVDKVLNHVSGKIRGVAAVYNRFEYLKERRAALDEWARYVIDLAAMCQERPFARQQNGVLFDHLVGKGKQSW
jgi:integrase